MARLLPAHLSHKSSLALLLPSSIDAPVEAVRNIHDKQFSRWPPHINLLYPFLASPSETVEQIKDPQLKQDIRARLQKVVKNIEPFHVDLDASRPGIFSHGRKSKTVWLAPSAHLIQELQAALQAEFSECDADQRPFNPHLTVGQAVSKDTAELLSQEIKNSVTNFLSKTEETASPSLHWIVDRLFVIEREGYNDRFKVVGAIDLGDKMNILPSVPGEEVS